MERFEGDQTTITIQNHDFDVQGWEAQAEVLGEDEEGKPEEYHMSLSMVPEDPNQYQANMILMLLDGMNEEVRRKIFDSLEKEFT